MAQRMAVRRSLSIGTPTTTTVTLPSRSLTTWYNSTSINHTNHNHNHHTAFRSNTYSTATNSVTQPHGYWNSRTTTTHRSFTIRATPPKLQDEKTTTTTTTNESTTTDECPEWNNPVLHSTEPSKIMLSEYPNDDGDNPPPIVPLPPMDLQNDGKVLAPPHLHAIAQEIVNLNMLEVKELVDRVADHFQIVDDGSSGLTSSSSSEGTEEAEEDTAAQEKTSFDLKLTGFDAKSKIKVIKEVRTITALGLKEAKALVDGVPKVLKEGLKKEDAEELKKTLEGIGATVEIV